MSADQLLLLALEMAQTGCSLIPVQKNKKPYIKWEKHQTACADAVQLRRWAANPRTAGFAVVCGPVSGGLEILDFDDPSFYVAFMAAAPAWAAGLPVQKTGGGGFQMAYRRPSPGGNSKLAWAAREADADGVVIEGGREIAIETRGEGGYAVIPHSLHPSGQRYAPLIGTFGNIPAIDDDQADELLALARGLDQTKKTQPQTVPQRAAAPRVSTDATGPRAYVLGGIQKELDRVVAARQGERNAALFEAAAALGNLVEAFHTPEGGGRELVMALSEAEARVLLTEAAQQQGGDDRDTPGQVQDTISSGLEKGKQTPRDVTGRGKKKGIKVGKNRGAPLAAGELPEVQKIPAPEVPIDDKGKMDYSDAQVLSLLGMEAWGVVSPHSEQAHAIRLKAIAGDDLLYVPGKDGREWHVWTSRHWRDGAGAVALAKGYANKLSGSLAPETARLEALAEVLHRAERDEDAAAMMRAARRHVRAAKAAEENKRQRAVLDLSSVHFLATKDAHELFALRPWVLGFENGTLDGDEFREHRREDYMLALLRVPYGEAWQGGEWEELLGRMTGGDTELAQTLQDVAGYILSGSSSQRVVFMAYGPARSGKSTFTALLETVLGDQANTVEPKHLSGEGVRGLLGSRLWNRRLGVCHEAGRVPIDTELLKTMSGGDSFTVKHLYKDEFTAQPTHALVLVANDPPRMDGLDPALRERVVALPFEYDLDPENRRDLFGGRKLEEVRREPHSVLVRDFTAWAAQGMRRVFLSRTIFLAPAVALATARLWEDMGDELAGFWETLNASEISLGVGVRELRGRYVDWCGVNGLKALPARKWDRACEAVGLEKKNTGQAWVWKWSRPGVAWPFDNLTAFTTFPRVPTEKSDDEQDAMGDISQGDFAKKVVKPVKPSDEGEEDALRKVVF